jgi:Flp pilus assembly protein TadG
MVGMHRRSQTTASPGVCLEARSSRKRARARDERGQSIVEFALVLPLLAVLMIGMIKFGILLNNYITLTNAVAAGARTLAVNRGVGTATPNACTLAYTALTNAATNLITSKITITEPPVFTTSSGSAGADTCTALVAGDAATMQATYPCDLLVFGHNWWPSCTLNSQTTIRIE